MADTRTHSKGMRTHTPVGTEHVQRRMLRHSGRPVAQHTALGAPLAQARSNKDTASQPAWPPLAHVSAHPRTSSAVSEGGPVDTQHVAVITCERAPVHVGVVVRIVPPHGVKHVAMSAHRCTLSAASEGGPVDTRHVAVSAHRCTLALSWS